MLFIFSIIFSVDDTIDMGGEGMHAIEANYSANMENVANMKTPGYKYYLMSAKYSPKTEKIIMKKYNIFTPGSYINSNRQLDFALGNKGFFVVIDKNGEIFYTRDGRFEIDENMDLVTMSGKFYVLDQDDSIIQLDQNNEIKIDQYGNLFNIEGDFIAKFKVVDISNVTKLKSNNNVYFYLNKEDSKNLLQIDDFVLKQGYYEGSNVNASMSLIKMADTGRYAAGTQLIQSRLKMLDTMIDIAKQN